MAKASRKTPARKKPPAPKTPGEALRQVRAACAMGQVEAAERAGMTQQHLSELENDKGDIKISTLRRLASVYAASVHELIPESW
jgi:transcriptional regulator with XRE-family HTH domain